VSEARERGDVVDVFRGTWEAERPDLAKEGERDGRYRVYCVACDTYGDHPSGEAYFIRMPEGEVRYLCLRCVGGGSSRISGAFREQAECHRELMREYERNAAAPVSLPPALRAAAREELEARESGGTR
jgi:hypothetical protein